MAGKTYGYKDKKIIISLFNESQTYYNKYKELRGGNVNQSQKELNTAGNKLQQSFELGLKCYLNKRYRELYNSKILSWKESEKLIQILEKGRQANGKIVDIKYLYDQMNLFAEPIVSSSGVDFVLIRHNNQMICNDNKHQGNDINQRKYEESYAEIRKFILTYIDSNPPIQMIQSSQYINLQQACDFWNRNTRYDYCLIIDQENIETSILRKILYINWSLIIDFDIYSEKTGLLKAYQSEYGIQPNSFNINNPAQTIFNPMSSMPYWFFINGVADVGESLAETDRKWNQKYASNLMECFGNYRQSFTKPLKVVILSGKVKRIEMIISALDAVYEDDLCIYLLSSEVQFESLREDYKGIMEYYPLTEFEFAQGINNFSSLFSRNILTDKYYICGKDGKVGIRLEDFSSFEIPYLDIADAACNEIEKQSEAFYQGKCTLSWYGAKNGFAINRVKQYRKIKNQIVSACAETTSKIIGLRHDPGAGGTTLSRLISYELSKEMPVILLKFFDARITSKQVENLYKLVRMSIVIVVESSNISEDDLQKFNGDLMSSAIPHVIVYVNRLGNRSKSTDDDLRMLIDTEFNEMFCKLQQYIEEGKQKELEKLSLRPTERYPFFMSMYAFDNEFKGVKDYIRHYLIQNSKNDIEKLTYISLVDKFANRELDVNFLSYSNLDDEIGIFENEINNNLVTLVERGKNRYVKIRHPRFADEIIYERISYSEGCKDIKIAEDLSLIIRKFIRDSKQNIMYDLDSTIDVIKNLLILRDTDSMVKNKFSPLIEFLKLLIPADVDAEERYNCIGLVFKELVNVYPDEPHFKAHLSRYYTHIEMNYIKGIEEAKEAVELAEQQSMYDPLLYHISGMSIRRYIEQKLFEEVRECLDFNDDKHMQLNLEEIKTQLENASKLFEKVRETNNKVAGYISDIEMCIAVVDFGKEIYQCSTEDFIKEHKESWFMQYYDRALTLMEGFQNIKVEEDTEFYKVRLSAKCDESLQEMIVSIEDTILMWEEYLEKAIDEQKPVVRRFIARAREKSFINSHEIDQSSIKNVLQLMEDNIKQEPSNGSNIRIWFNALRYLEGDNSDILLDDALQKLATWKKIGDNFEAYYYYFILVCIKAIEGSSRAESLIPSLQDELKNKTAHMPNNRVIYEWLGAGNGVGRLINAYQSSNGRRNRKAIDEIEEKAQYIVGRISKYTNDRSARIRAYNMEVFFSPSGQLLQATEEDVNKKVRFILGFSYDGLRALNKSVEIVDFTDDQDQNKELTIGKMVKCMVIGNDNAGKFLKVKLVDYRNVYGSVHISELPNGVSVYDFEKDDIVWGRIIGEQYVKFEKRNYYQISVKDDELPDDWKKQLSDMKKKLK